MTPRKWCCCLTGSGKKGVLKWSRIEYIRNMFRLDSYKSIRNILFYCFHVDFIRSVFFDSIKLESNRSVELNYFNVQFRSSNYTWIELDGYDETCNNDHTCVKSCRMSYPHWTYIFRACVYMEDLSHEDILHWTKRHKSNQCKGFCHKDQSTRKNFFFL